VKERAASSSLGTPKNLCVQVGTKALHNTWALLHKAGTKASESGTTTSSFAFLNNAAAVNNNINTPNSRQFKGCV
jgi:hypothetical protein